MLSQGQWHTKVPTERRENLAYRLWLLRQAHDPAYRQGVLTMCAGDIVFWINSFVYQYNPLKAGGEYGPFVAWDFQEEALHELLWCIRNNQSAVIEKSREMGGTYLCVLIIAWACLFHRHKKFLVISRDADAVDRPGDPDCVFWKIDQILEHLPDWMTGGVNVPGGITRRKMLFGFPSGSKITGQASTGKAGVGGRATAIFLDEFSQVKEDREVRQRTASTTNCRIFNGTHLGSGTEFFKLCQQPEVKKIQMHWTQHPDKRLGLYKSGGRQGVEVLDKTYPFPADYRFVKDGTPTGGPFPGLRSPWYDQKCKDIGDRLGVAMDLDMDPKGSVSQIFDPLTVRALIEDYCRPPRWEGELDYDPISAEPYRLTPKKGGLIKLWMSPDANGRMPDLPAAVTADVSTGKGATNSCLSGGNTDTGEKFLEVATPHMDENEFATLAVAVCRLFGSTGAVLGWERQGPGETFGRKVQDLGYRNVWIHRGAVMKTRNVCQPGFLPTPSSKRMLINSYATALAARQFVNHSELAMLETLDWKYGPQGEVLHGGQISCRDPSGAAVNHGDRSVADAILWLITKPRYVRAKILEVEEVRQDTLAWRQRERYDALRREESWS